MKWWYVWMYSVCFSYFIVNSLYISSCISLKQQNETDDTKNNRGTINVIVADCWECNNGHLRQQRRKIEFTRVTFSDWKKNCMKKNGMQQHELLSTTWSSQQQQQHATVAARKLLCRMCCSSQVCQGTKRSVMLARGVILQITNLATMRYACSAAKNHIVYWVCWNYPNVSSADTKHLQSFNKPQRNDTVTRTRIVSPGCRKGPTKIPTANVEPVVPYVHRTSSHL